MGVGGGKVKVQGELRRLLAVWFLFAAGGCERRREPAFAAVGRSGRRPAAFIPALGAGAGEARVLAAFGPPPAVGRSGRRPAAFSDALSRRTAER
jgi:hypothetical protein